jgi:hypothetical protein
MKTMKQPSAIAFVHQAKGQANAEAIVINQNGVFVESIHSDPDGGISVLSKRNYPLREIKNILEVYRMVGPYSQGVRTLRARASPDGYLLETSDPLPAKTRYWAIVFGHYTYWSDSLEECTRYIRERGGIVPGQTIIYDRQANRYVTYEQLVSMVKEFANHSH